MIGQDDEGGYGYYPAPVEHNALAYDTLWVHAHEHQDSQVAVVDIPGRAALYWGLFAVTEDSPLRSEDRDVRGRATTRLLMLVGERVAESLKE